MINFEIQNPRNIRSLNREEISYLQGLLNVNVDGILGPQTLGAWREFKKLNWLDEYELIGPASLSLLERKNPNEKVDWSNFESKVSKYFTVGEVCQFERRRLVSDPSHRMNVINLAKELDKLREKWGSAILVTSWYRPPAVNREVGGVSNSQHLNGSAVDITPLNGQRLEFERFLDREWGNRALGWGQRNKRGFTHLDLRVGRNPIRWNY